MTRSERGGFDRAAPWVYEAAAPDWVDELARELPDRRRLRGIELDPDDQYYPSEDDFDDEPSAADVWYTPHGPPLRYPGGGIRAVPTDDTAGSRGGLEATGRAPTTGRAAVPRFPDRRPSNPWPIDSGPPDSRSMDSWVPDAARTTADELAPRRRRPAVPDPADFDPGHNPWHLDPDAPAGAPWRPEADAGRADARPTAWSEGRKQWGSDRYTERPTSGRGPIPRKREAGRVNGPDDRRTSDAPPAHRHAADNRSWTADVPANLLRDPSGAGLDDLNSDAPGGSGPRTGPHRAVATSTRPQAPQPAPPAAGPAPRVVSTTTSAPLPRVLNRSAPPVAPRVINRTAPPPAPRVISTSTPPVTPRAGAPAAAPPPAAVLRPTAPPPAAVLRPTAPPAARRPAASPAIEPTPPGSPDTRLATPGPATTGPATSPATTGPADTEGVASGGGRVIPLRRRPPPTEQADRVRDPVPRPTPGRPIDIPPAAGTTMGSTTEENRTAVPGPRLVAVRWRLDGATLREVVDDRESLRALGAHLDQRLTESTDNLTRARLLCLRAEVFRLLDELGMAGAASRLALAHAEAAGDPAAMVIAQAELAHVLRLCGDVAEADRLFEQAASADVSDALRCLVHENAGRCCFDQGRYMEALDHFGRAVRLGDPADLDFVERIDVCLETVYIRVLRDGWGPYRRLRQEILAVSAPAAPEPDSELFDPPKHGPDDGARAPDGVATPPVVPQQVQRVADGTPAVSPGAVLRAAVDSRALSGGDR